MALVYKEKGKTHIRPPFIGFIKNNWLRRGAMLLTAPFMFVLVATVNLIMHGFLWLNSLRGIFESTAWGSDLWHEPRKHLTDAELSLQKAEHNKAIRALAMPDKDAALKRVREGHQRLKDLELEGL